MNTPLSHRHNGKKLDKGRVGRAGFEAFLNICKKWKIKAENQRILLGGIPKTTYYTWKKQLEALEDFILPKDVLERISYIMGIYKALHILLPGEAANQWIHKNNTASLFNNQSALDKMLQGNVVDLADVRRYLDAQLER